MIKGYWIKLTKECLLFENHVVQGLYLFGKKSKCDAENLYTALIWLFCLGTTQNKSGHFVIDKSIFITKEAVVELNWMIPDLICALKEIKSQNMIIYENEKEFFSFLESCYEV